MKKILALVFSLIILEQNSNARYEFNDENEDLNSWSSTRNSWNDDEDDYSYRKTSSWDDDEDDSSYRKTSSWDDDADDYDSSYRKTSSWDDDADDYDSSYRKTSSWDDDEDDSSYRKTSSWNDDEDDYDSSYQKTSSWDDEDDYDSSYRKTSSWDDDADDYDSSYRKTSSWDDEDDYDSSYRKTSSWDDVDDLDSSYRKTSSWDDDEDDYNSSYRKTSSWDDEDDYDSSYRKTSSWDDDEDDYNSSYRKTSSWDDDDYSNSWDDEDDYDSSYRKTSSWDDEDDYDSSYRKTSSWDDEDDYDSSYRKTSSWDDDDWDNPRSKKKQREQEKSLIKKRNQEAINRIILDETPENEKIDLLTDQLKLANTRMKKYISKLKRKSADPNLDFIEQSFKFNNDGIGILLENSRADAEWKGKIFKENPESDYNNNEEETEEQTTTDGSLVIYDQVTDKYIREINKMTRKECQKKVRNGIIDKEYFFQLSLDNSQKINKAVTSIIEAVENRNGKTSQINKRRDMENAPKLRLLVALNSNLFKDVEFVRSIKNQIKVLGESIRESYETASENVKKNHPYLKFLIVDKI